MRNVLIIAKPYDAEVMRSALRDAGFEPVISDGSDLVAARVERERPAAVVLSLRLATADGAELLRRIRDGAHGGSAPVILVADSTSEVTTLSAAVSLGADQLLLRPVNPAQLLAKLGAVLELDTPAPPPIRPASTLVPPIAPDPEDERVPVSATGRGTEIIDADSVSSLSAPNNEDAFSSSFAGSDAGSGSLSSPPASLANELQAELDAIDRRLFPDVEEPYSLLDDEDEDFETLDNIDVDRIGVDTFPGAVPRRPRPTATSLKPAPDKGRAGGSGVAPRADVTAESTASPMVSALRARAPSHAVRPAPGAPRSFADEETIDPEQDVPPSAAGALVRHVNQVSEHVVMRPRRRRGATSSVMRARRAASRRRRATERGLGELVDEVTPPPLASPSSPESHQQPLQRGLTGPLPRQERLEQAPGASGRLARRAEEPLPGAGRPPEDIAAPSNARATFDEVEPLRHADPGLSHVRTVTDDDATEPVVVLDDAQAELSLRQATPPAPLALSGGLADTTVAQLLEQVRRSAFSGRLRARRDSTEKSIFFEDGYPVFASSNAAHDRLGALLLREGKITREQAQECEVLVGRSGRRLGAILVDKGLLKAQELFPLVRRHVTEIIYSLFSWSSGSYELKPETPAPGEKIRLDSHPAALIAEGVRRKLPLDRLLEAVGGHEATLVVPSDALDRLERAELSALERAVVARLGGDETLGQLVARGVADELTVFQAAFIVVALGAGSTREGRAARVGSLGRAREVAIDRQRLETKYAQVCEGDYFSLLGLRPDASAHEVLRAYERVRREFEPATFPPELVSEHAARISEIVAVIDEAFRVLSNDSLRSAYRETL